MNEEEKKAIEYLDFCEPDDLVECVMYRKALDTIINLIEKQQKEIEKLKNHNKNLLRKLRNRIKELNKLTKYSQYKKEFSKLNKEIEELKEYKKISELTKISCCTAQNCEALNNAIREGLENQKLREKLDKKDKIIDLMATFIDRNGIYMGMKCQQDVIDYFTKKVEEE